MVTPPSFFAQDVLNFQGLFCFQVNFKVVGLFFCFCDEACWRSDEDCIDADFSRVAGIILPIREHGRSTHLLVSVSNSIFVALDIYCGDILLPWIGGLGTYL